MSRLVSFLFLSLLIMGCATTGNDPSHTYQQPFVSDGCSRWPDAQWHHCCLSHDVAYWQGGPESLRLAADEALMACVVDTGYPTIAQLMFVGVRVGGVPYLSTPYRWGYGQVAD